MMCITLKSVTNLLRRQEDGYRKGLDKADSVTILSGRKYFIGEKRFGNQENNCKLCKDFNVSTSLVRVGLGGKGVLTIIVLLRWRDFHLIV